MSNEIFQIAVLGMLVLLLLLQLYDLALQRSAIAGIVDAFDEKEATTKRKNHDISDIMETGNYEKALRETEKRLSDNPIDAGLYWYKGMALYHLERWGPSLEALEKSIEYEPLYEKDLGAYITLLNRRLNESE